LSDIDECADITTCHTCTNNVGSYVCGCNPGYAVKDNVQCEGISCLFMADCTYDYACGTWYCVYCD